MANVYWRKDTWYVRFRFKGQEIRKSADTKSETKARRYLEQLRAQYEKAEEQGRNRHGFGVAMNRFVEEHLPNMQPLAADRYMVSVRHLNKAFGDKYLDEITPRVLADYVSDRRATSKAQNKSLANATLKRDLACLSSMFSCAMGWEIAERNPVEAMDKRSLREPPGRVRFLTRAEYAELLAKAGALHGIIVVAIETGMRMGEILSLRWTDIDWRHNSARLPTSKNLEPRTIPLTPTARAQIRAQARHAETPLVFHTKDGRALRVIDISRKFRKVAEDAGIEDFRFHDLRHTFASWAVQRGVDLYKLSKVLGHKGLQMTARYAHLRQDDLRGVVDDSGTLPGTDTTDMGYDSGD